MKKSTLRSNHWSDDKTSGYSRDTTYQSRPLGNNYFDDTCREGTEDRVKITLSLNTAKVDSGSRSAEKAEANGCLKEAILNMDKVASREHNGDPGGNILNCGDKASNVQTPYGESVGDKRHTHPYLSLPSLQTQKDVGPSYNLGPFRENEGSNKDGHSPVAHSFKEISDMYSKVYVRQKHAKSKAPISRARGRRSSNNKI